MEMLSEVMGTPNQVILQTQKKAYNLEDEIEALDAVDVNSDDDKSISPKKQVLITYFQPGTWIHTKQCQLTGAEVPHIIDFFSECKAKYSDESQFLIKCSDHNVFACPTNEEGAQKTNEIDVDGFPINEPQRTDPLSKTIRSITDRLVLQHLIADPRSYLKPGGSDMHYDQDDPFLDDQELYKESNWKKNFELSSNSSSVVGECSEGGSFADSFIFGAQEVNIDPSDFIFDNVPDHDIPPIETEIEEISFNPSGWRSCSSHIPASCVKCFERIEGKLQVLPDNGVYTKILWDLMKKEIKEILNILAHPSRLNDDGMIVWEGNICQTKFTEIGSNSASQNLQTQSSSFKSSKKRVGFVQINSRSLLRLIKCFRRITNAATKRQICKYWISLMLVHNFSLLCKYEDIFISILKASKIFEKGNQSYADKIRFYINLWKKEKAKKTSRENDSKDKVSSSHKKKVNHNPLPASYDPTHKHQPPPVPIKESKRENLLIGFQNKNKIHFTNPFHTYCKAFACIAEDLLKYSHLISSYKSSVRFASTVFFQILGEKLQAHSCEQFPQIFSDLLRLMFHKRFNITLIVPRDFIADILKIYQNMYHIDNYILKKFKRRSNQLKISNQRSKKQINQHLEDSSTTLSETHLIGQKSLVLNSNFSEVSLTTPGPHVEETQKKPIPEIRSEDKQMVLNEVSPKRQKQVHDTLNEAPQLYEGSGQKAHNLELENKTLGQNKSTKQLSLQQIDQFTKAIYSKKEIIDVDE